MSAVGFGAHYGVTGYEPAGALMADGSADYFTWIPSAAGSTTIATVSCWVKRNKIGAQQYILFAGRNSTPAEGFTFAFDANNKLNFAIHNGSAYVLQKISTAVYRDTTSWMHILALYNTATGANNFYVNGVEITAWDTNTNASSSEAIYLHSVQKHRILAGSSGGSLAFYNSTYVADLITLDGVRGSLSDFGETDSGTGIWIAKNPSDIASFGSAGIWMDFGDGNNIERDAANGTTTAAPVTGASGIWSGDTGSFTFSGDDLEITAGDKGIYTTNAYLGNVVVTGVWHGDFSQGGIGFAKYSSDLPANFSSGAAIGIHTGQRMATVLNLTSGSDKLHFHDFENATSNRMTTTTPEATSTTNPSGEDFEWRRSAAGVVTFKLNSTTIFTGNDGYTGPVHLMFGNHGTTTSPIDIDDLSIAHEGLAGNRAVPISIVTTNAVGDVPANSTTKEITLHPCWDSAAGNDGTWSNNDLTHKGDGSYGGTKSTLLLADLTYWEIRNDGRSAPSSDGDRNSAGVMTIAADADSNLTSNSLYWGIDNALRQYSATTGGTDHSGSWDVGEVLCFAIRADGSDSDLWISEVNTSSSWLGGGNPATPATPTLTITGYTPDKLHAAINNYATTDILTGIFDENTWNYAAPTGFSALTKTVTAVGNYATWNPLSDNGGGVALSDGNLNANRTGDPGTIQATLALPESGKWAWQSIIDEQDVAFHGIMGSDQFGTAFGGSPAGNAGYVACMIYHSSQGSELNKETSNINTGLTNFAAGDIIEILVDVGSATMDVKRNGSAHGSQITGIAIQKPWIPFIGSGQQMDYGATDFGQNGYTPSDSTYKTLHTGNFPEPTVTAPSEHFNTVLYTGNGTAIGSGGKTISDVGFAADFVWIKNRDQNDDHRVFDCIRAAQNFLEPSSDIAENGGGSAYAEMLNAFTSTGFTLGDNVSVNTNTEDYVAWCLKAGGTPSADNDNTSSAMDSNSVSLDGALQSSYTPSGSPSIYPTKMSINTTAGFSIISYTGSSNTTLPHGLSSAPKMVIIKRRNSAAQWAVWHTGLTSTQYYLNLDDSGAQADYGSTFISPGSDVITLDASSSLLNNTGDTYICYAFADIDGFSKFGSWIGNGESTDGPFIYCGFKPAFVMHKRSAGEIGNWVLQDVQRNPYNPVGIRLNADNTNDESTVGVQNIDILSNGFKIRNGSGGSNTSGHTYIYWAFAATPFASNNRAR